MQTYRLTCKLRGVPEFQNIRVFHVECEAPDLPAETPAEVVAQAVASGFFDPEELALFAEVRCDVVPLCRTAAEVSEWGATY
jgi:hypothetical protein